MISEKMQRHVDAVIDGYGYYHAVGSDRSFHLMVEQREAMVCAIGRIEAERDDALRRLADREAQIKSLSLRCSRVVVVARTVCVDAVKDPDSPVGFSFGRVKAFLHPGDLDVDDIFEVEDPIAPETAPEGGDA